MSRSSRRQSDTNYGRSVRRSNSAGSSRSHKKSTSGSQSARQAWIDAVNKRNTGFTDRGFQSGTTTHDRWAETLRQCGVATDDTFTGLTNSESLSYLSTSHYLRQVVGLEKSSKPDTARSAGGNSYKTTEDYHDEVTELKKKIHLLNQEIAHYKQNAQRLKEDNKKKEKEIDHLTNPTKSDDLRRTLTDKRGENAIVIQNMKQRILKLEQKLKEKEMECSKLQSDMKLTKTEEMKIHLEEMYAEIIRLYRTIELRDKHPVDTKKSSKPQKKAVSNENEEVIKALREDILKMNSKNHELQIENNDLKNELLSFKNTSEQQKKYKDKYDDMNKSDLLDVIAKLEGRLERAERWAASSTEGDDKRTTQDKIVLHGSLQDRVHQLDKRETELLLEIDKLTKVNKQLQDDRIYYRNKCDEKDKEIKELKKDSGSTNKSPQAPQTDTGRSMSRASLSSRRSSTSSDKALMEKAERLRQNNAAKKIQRGWRSHVNEQQDEATEYIQSVMRGHMQRNSVLQQADESDAESVVYGSLLAHKARRDVLTSSSQARPR